MGIRMRRALTARRSLSRFRGKRGVALIIVLGIVALLMILVMSFAFDAQTTSQVANINDDRTRARSIARSGLERAIAFVANELADTTDGSSLNPGANFFEPTGTAWDGRRYIMTSDASFDTGVDEALHVILGDYDFTRDDVRDGLSTAGWARVYSYKDGSDVGAASSMDTTIVGQVAYLVIDETGKVDPAAWVDATVDDGAAFVGTRLDTDVTALQLVDLFSSDAALARRLHPTNHATYPGTKEPSIDWLSHRLLQRSIPESQADADSVAQLLIPLSRADDESTWYDVNSDSVVDSGELVDRLDLTNVGPAGVTAADLYDHFLGVAAGNTTRDDAAYLSPWLKSLGYADMNTNRLIAARVATYMVDWADTADDDSPAGANLQPDISWIQGAGQNYELSTTTNTVPSPPANYVMAIPGIEEAPSLVSLGIQLNYSWSGDDLIVTPGFYARMHNPTGDLAINGLAGTLAVTASVVMRGSLSGDFTQVVTGTIDLATLSNTGSFQTETADWSSFTVTPASFTCAAICGILNAGTWRVRSIQITDISITTEDAEGRTRDLVSLPLQQSSASAPTYQFAANETVLTLNPHNATPADDIKIWHAEDAYLNHYDQTSSLFNWTPDPAGTALGAIGAMPARNLYATYDFGEATVGNRPFASWADLGRVHAWSENRSVMLWTRSGGLGADLHDCHMYDLFKLGNHDGRFGRVNLNTNSAAVLGALLGWQANMGSLVSDLQSREKLQYRGDIADVMLTATGLRGATQDEAAEAEFAGWMDHTTTRSNYYTVIVCAQSTKDLGVMGSPPAGAIKWQTVAGDDYYMRVVSEAKLMAFVHRDAYTGEMSILRIDYLED